MNNLSNLTCHLENERLHNGNADTISVSKGPGFEFRAKLNFVISTFLGANVVVSVFFRSFARKKSLLEGESIQSDSS